MEEVDKEKRALHLSSRGKVEEGSQDGQDYVEENRLGILDYISEKGYGDIISLTSFLFMPYIVGLFFVFIVVAGLNPMIFMYVLNMNALFSTWAIGYEILAILAIFWIAKVLLTSYLEVREYNQLHKKLKIP
ncbi:MAG: hypothetical protein U9Q90_06185 [Campylobacterota bacterium]|nr:hypothetical protein [Campylobacterota bacterium]